MPPVRVWEVGLVSGGNRFIPFPFEYDLKLEIHVKRVTFLYENNILGAQVRT